MVKKTKKRSLTLWMNSIVHQGQRAFFSVIIINFYYSSTMALTTCESGNSHWSIAVGNSSNSTRCVIYPSMLIFFGAGLTGLDQNLHGLRFDYPGYSSPACEIRGHER